MIGKIKCETTDTKTENNIIDLVPDLSDKGTINNAARRYPTKYAEYIAPACVLFKFSSISIKGNAATKDSEGNRMKNKIKPIPTTLIREKDCFKSD